MYVKVTPHLITSALSVLLCVLLVLGVCFGDVSVHCVYIGSRNK